MEKNKEDALPPVTIYTNEDGTPRIVVENAHPTPEMPLPDSRPPGWPRQRDNQSTSDYLAERVNDEYWKNL